MANTTQSPTDKSIQLRESNPYAYGVIYSETNASASDEEQLERTPLAYVGSANDQYYTVRHGDMLDSIAYRYYKDVDPFADKWYWVIADANDIENPLDLSAYVGKDILIPDLLTVKLLL